MGVPNEEPNGPSQTEVGDLPAYQTDDLVEHSYTLSEGSSSKPWAILKLHSRAKVASHMPLFMEGDTIAGFVELDLPTKKKFKEINLLLEGETLRVGQEPFVFYKDSRPLWNSKINETNTTNLIGSYSWPFTISLPREVHVTLTNKNSADAVKAPPSFTDRASPAYIDYKLSITFRRGGLQVNQVLSAGLNYIACNRVPTPSELRMIAYETGSAIPGPDADPSGWKVLDNVRLNGMVFSDRSVEFEFKFAIAFPLIYSPNSSVPVWITLTGTDGQATSLLMASKPIEIRLRRSLAVGQDANDDNRNKRSDNTFDEICARGITWPVELNQGREAGREETTGLSRVLEGELSIPIKTKASFIFPSVSLRYYVDFLLNETPGLTFTGHVSTIPLTSQKIEIAIDGSSRNVLRRSRAPPAYVTGQDVRYDNSIGVLTAANQRFCHYGHSLG